MPTFLRHSVVSAVFKWMLVVCDLVDIDRVFRRCPCLEPEVMSMMSPHPFVQSGDIVIVTGPIRCHYDFKRRLVFA